MPGATLCTTDEIVSGLLSNRLTVLPGKQAKYYIFYIDIYRSMQIYRDYIDTYILYILHLYIRYNLYGGG